MVSMNGPRKLFQEMVNDNGAQVSSKVVSKRGHQEMSQRMVSNVRACGHRGGGRCADQTDIWPRIISYCYPLPSNQKCEKKEKPEPNKSELKPTEPRTKLYLKTETTLRRNRNWELISLRSWAWENHLLEAAPANKLSNASSSALVQTAPLEVIYFVRCITRT